MSRWPRALGAAGLGAVLVLPGGGAGSYGGVSAYRAPDSTAYGALDSTYGPVSSYAAVSTYAGVSSYAGVSTNGRVSSYAAVSSYGAVPSFRTPTPTPSAESPSPSRAGNPAGEGRNRPGRMEEPLREPPRERPPEDAAEEADTPPAEPATGAPEAAVERTGEPVLRILPLGSGMVLIGLGLGLAFVGLRVRRGRG
ncbi:hypothetical protein ACWDV7_05175 [Streptomyces sp. NPDC003362]